MKSFFKLDSFDPRTKLMLMFCLSIVAIFRPEPLLLLCLLGFTLLVLLAGGAHPARILRQARGIFYMIIMLFIIQSLFVRTGDPLISLGNFTLITTGGLETAAVICLRLLILVMSALILLTGESRDYLPALVQMKIPYEIAFMVMAAVHFLPILKEEALDVYYSVQLRGTEIAKAPIPKKLRAFSKICMPILVGTVNRARQMSIAMETRGFRSRPRRTYLHTIKLKTKDAVLLVLLPAATAALFIYM